VKLPLKGPPIRRPIRLVQTSIGDYRQAFLDILLERLGDDLEVYAGEVYFDGVTRTRVDIGEHLRPLRNVYLVGRRILWQRGALRAAVGAGIAVLELNPRILSVWVALLVRWLGRRPTVLWGHAWSRSGRASRTNRLRRIMRRPADGTLVYTEQQALELAETGERNVYVAPNALYRWSDMVPALAERPTDFLYVGRLVPEKRPDLLLSAFVSAIDRLPPQTRLVFVGDGPRSARLREVADSLAKGRVLFEGHISDPDQLRAIYARSIASVSPGFVGLSITQSLGYGVPMVIARNEPHSPEIEAAVEGWNAIFFSPTSSAALADALVAASLQPAAPSLRRAISEDCRRRYSAEVMAEGFIEALIGVTGARAT